MATSRAHLRAGMILVALATSVASRGQPASPSAAEGVIDQTPVLRAGQVELSRYALEKNFRRFQLGTTSWRNPPGPAEVEQWLKGFLAERLIIAHALSLGYGTRPEVERPVADMERYMLTQPAGPFYERLYAELRPLPAETTRQWYEASNRDIKVAALEFPTAERQRVLGSDWPQLPEPQKLERLRMAARQFPICTFFESRFSWPYYPVGNLPGPPVPAMPGTWHEHTEESADTSWIFFVQAVLTREQPAYEVRRGEFEPWVNQLRRQEYRHQRQLRVLKQAGFAFDATLAAGVMQHLAFLPDNQVALAASAPPGLADAPLCRYRIGSRDESLAVARWVAQHNVALVRLAPRELPALRENVRSLVLAEIDLREAQQLGVPREAKFIEDKRNFFYAQVLALYEKERCPPGDAVSGQEVEAYFDEHQNQITVPREQARFFIRQVLIRDRLAPWRLQLAREIATRLEIEDTIPYAEYGVGRLTASWFGSDKR